SGIFHPNLAVVAMLARVSHPEALPILFPRPRRNFRTWLKDLKRALGHRRYVFCGVDFVPAKRSLRPRWSRFGGNQMSAPVFTGLFFNVAIAASGESSIPIRRVREHSG